METLKLSIVGQGFSGMISFANLVKKAPAGLPLEFDLYETQLEKGGLAYRKSLSRDFLMNGFISEMSAWEDQPMHLFEWLNQADRTKWPEKWRLKSFEQLDHCPRALYGIYLQEQLESAKALAHEKGFVVESIQEHVVEILKNSRSSWKIKTNQRARESHVVLLCTGHLEAQVPSVLKEHLHSDKIIHNIWTADALKRIEQIPEQDEVAILGLGLTSVDLSKVLFTANRSAPVHLISRNGLLMPAYTPYAQKRGFHFELRVDGLLNPQGQPSLSLLSDLLQKTFVRAQREGFHPEEAYRVVKKYFPWILAQIEPSERPQFMALFKKWDNFRTGLPWESSEFLKKLMDERKIFKWQAPDLKISLADKEGFRLQGLVGEKNGIFCKWIINATGFVSQPQQSANPLQQSLLKNGICRPHELGFGLDCNELGQSISANGKVHNNLFVLGAPTMGAHFEREGKLGTSQSIVGLREQITRMLPAALLALYKSRSPAQPWIGPSSFRISAA